MAPDQIIDCDFHQGWKDPEEVTQYLPKHYQHRGLTVPTFLYKNPGGTIRDETIPEDANLGASDIDLIREQHLDEYDIDYAVLNAPSPLLSIPQLPNPDYAFELAKAYNKWVINKWLSKDGERYDKRFRGSLMVAPSAPERSADMIREMATHPRIIQVLMGGGEDLKPYGADEYWPIYEAAEELGLPIGLHTGGSGMGTSYPPTGAGYPETYFEWHNVFPATFMGQVSSLISNGVFEEFPTLKWVFIEGGFAWVPHMMWRMDQNWRGLRRQVPWLEKPPSEYINEHIRFTTQPIYEPNDPNHLNQILDMVNANKTIMFSSDYPHWNTDDIQFLEGRLSEPTQSRIFNDNAKEIYNLNDGE